MPHSYSKHKRNELLDMSLANIKNAMDIIQECERTFNPDPDYSDFNSYDELVRVLRHAHDTIWEEYLFVKDLCDMYREHVYFLEENEKPRPKEPGPDPTVLARLFDQS